MFVGHYSVALAIKAVEPRAPLWTVVAGCQLMDIAWSVFVMAGVEYVGVDSALPGSPFILSDMPYTHSLPGSLAWSIAWGAFALLILRLPLRPALLIGASVFSHWLLDLLVHRPDLELWFGGPRVGFALWNAPVLEEAIEMGLLAIAGAAWAASRKDQHQPIWSALAFLGVLVVFQVADILVPMQPQPLVIGAAALSLYLLAIALSIPLDTQRAPAPERE